MLELGKYSLGMGDRFGHQAAAQLRACVMAADGGVQIVPVWNKSNREHNTIGSEPARVRIAADDEDLRADLLETALPVERLRARVALPDTEPQFARAAATGLVFNRGHELA